jgi:hypothetical protein
MTDPILNQALFNIARELEETRKVLQQILEQIARKQIKGEGVTMKSEDEIRRKIGELEVMRKSYLERCYVSGGTDYSRKLYHYIRILRWVIGELDDDSLGLMETKAEMK